MVTVSATLTSPSNLTVRSSLITLPKPKISAFAAAEPTVTLSTECLE